MSHSDWNEAKETVCQTAQPQTNVGVFGWMHQHKRLILCLSGIFLCIKIVVLTLFLLYGLPEWWKNGHFQEKDAKGEKVQESFPYKFHREQYCKEGEGPGTFFSGGMAKW